MTLDLTTGSSTFASTTVVRFSADEGASTFVDLIAPAVHEVTLNGRGLPRLKVSYHDEDGASLSEWFALETPAQRGAFAAVFLRDHLRAEDARDAGL